MPNLSAGKSPRDFNPIELAKGMKVEMEHTDNPRIAQQIAMDHLTENPRYYIKLAQMEDPWMPVKHIGGGAVIGFVLAKLFG